MRERAGFIIGISGVVLLLKPNFDPEQMAIYRRTAPCQPEEEENKREKQIAAT